MSVCEGWWVAFITKRQHNIGDQYTLAGESPCCCLIGQGLHGKCGDGRYIVQLFTLVPIVNGHKMPREPEEEPERKAPIAAFNLVE